MFDKRALKSIVGLFIILLLITGCTSPALEEGIKTENVAEKAEKIDPTNDLTDHLSQETEKEETSDDPVKERYDSLDEMIHAAEMSAGNATNSVQTSVEQSDLEKYYDYFYVPTAIPDEYALSHITVSKYNIQYRYKLISNPNDHTMNITVTFDNPNQFLDKDPMQTAVNQIGIPLTEDGYLHYSDLRDIIFPVGGSSMCIRVPDHMNTYEQLKPLCVATKYTVRNDNSSLVTE